LSYVRQDNTVLSIKPIGKTNEPSPCLTCLTQDTKSVDDINYTMYNAGSKHKRPAFIYAFIYIKTFI